MAALSAHVWQPLPSYLVPSTDDAPGVRKDTARTLWCTVRSWRATPATPHVTNTWSTTDATHDAVVEPPAKKPKNTRGRKKPSTPIGTEEELQVRKIKVHPSAAQRATLKQWCGAARYVYNQVVHHLQAKQGNPNLKELRDLYACNAACSDKPWLLEVPYDVRDGALLDAVTAYKTGKQRMKEDPCFKFRLSFRTKKAQSESIYICKRAFRNGTIYPQKKLGALHYRETLPEIEHDCRLQRTWLGEYFMCVPVAAPRPAAGGENQAPPKPVRIVALDPGVRTFLSAYDLTGGGLHEIAPGDIGRIVRLCMHLDKLASKVAHSRKAKARLRLRKAAARLRRRIRALVDDMHRKVACYLAESYDVILLPIFETGRMVRRARRRIHSKTARMMLTWAHYRFRVRLQWRAKRTGAKVVIVDEAYTSKTCGHCGQLHERLGGAKKFHCPSCHHELDRDANAARNILLRNAAVIGLHKNAPSFQGRQCRLGPSPHSSDE